MGKSGKHEIGCVRVSNEKNILVAGLGYVGLANALLLSQHNHVFAYDIDQEKLNKLKQKKVR